MGRDLQNDFRARLDWCVRDHAHANHPPVAVLNGQQGKAIVRWNDVVPAAKSLGVDATPFLLLSAAGSADPDDDKLTYQWWIYNEAGTYAGSKAEIEDSHSSSARLRLPPDLGDRELHVILIVRDSGTPPLTAYRRLIVSSR